MVSIGMPLNKPRNKEPSSGCTAHPPVMFLPWYQPHGISRTHHQPAKSTSQRLPTVGTRWDCIFKSEVSSNRYISHHGITQVRYAALSTIEHPQRSFLNTPSSGPFISMFQKNVGFMCLCTTPVSLPTTPGNIGGSLPFMGTYSTR